MSDSDDIGKIFNTHKVKPDVVAVAPKEILKVTYANGITVDCGKELTPTQVKAPPTLEWSAQSDKLYTLTFTDPDAPSRKSPTFREYQHWIVGNIPGDAVAKGEVLTAYVGSGPPEGTGLHRYVFLIFEQSGKLKFKEEHIPKTSGKNRGKFSVMKFSKNYKLGDPIAGNFYQAQWDDYVPTVHRQLSGKG